MPLSDKIKHHINKIYNLHRMHRICKEHGISLPASFPYTYADFIDIINTVKNYRRESNILIDIGSFSGGFSFFCNIMLNIDHIICFEPNHDLNKQIKNNLSRVNKLIVEEIALAQNNGPATFFKHSSGSMSSIVKHDNSKLRSDFNFDDPNKIEEINIETVNLDTYIENNNLSNQKFFLKIDTQGNELNILKGGQSTLKNTEICMIEHMFYSPYHSNYNFQELVDFMYSNYFECVGALDISRRPSGKISGVDFLFHKSFK